MKFVLLVEGQTERDVIPAFFKQWLDKQLKQPVGIRIAAFDGYADLVAKIANKARAYLKSPQQSEIVAVIALIDLYGPTFYPPAKATADDRYDWAKDHFERQVNDSRFRMFLAMHECEAWLLSDPEIFPREVRSALSDKFTNSPERVNFDEPPAKLLDRVYRQRLGHNYKKVTYGKQLFAKLKPEVARQKCPRLKMMLDEMLRLARDAGL
ncbi:MAG: DUF4276 family protein [Pirellulales bacterium]|nr:DUF4276 family protein [Pirellulales bacterium]